MNPMSPSLPADLRDDPLYYLRHFQFVLDWVMARHADLLAEPEQRFIMAFGELPESAQALLVRMVSRKGELFRTGRLVYAEVDDLEQALSRLAAAELVELDPVLSLDDLLAQLRLSEARRVFAETVSACGLPASVSKSRLCEALDGQFTPRRWSAWWPESDETLVRVSVMSVCDRLRLMFFGNLRQSWSDFVMAELGHMRYERVSFDPASRGFQQRHEVDTYLCLHRLRERFDDGEAVADIWSAVPALPEDNPWLAARRSRLLLRLGQQAQRVGQVALALEIFSFAGPGEARVRRLRLLEREGEHRQALTLATQALEAPLDDAERQALARLVPRLQRRLGEPVPKPAAQAPPQSWSLSLPPQSLAASGSVELALRDHLARDEAPAFYVENHLFAGLFGLLCWDVIFAPLPGAFFHPFHRGPADLYRPDFVSRRRDRFDACLEALASGDYRERTRARWRDKQGLANPFVYWEVLDETLLELALHCIAPEHLAVLFERLLEDLKANRSGWPDLIQFFPDAGEGQPRYRLIEVKAPGDRLQDNQRRWLQHFQCHGIPVSVCHVRWSDG
ncbi:MAG: nuclease [Halomonas sp.]|nr:nuclease [Halomonas sp.]|tara:strand:- start:2952 stop:4646 length:1695 start_codon:yes stop_codon:yes gene_type:complete